MMTSMGICIGASTVSAVTIADDLSPDSGVGTKEPGGIRVLTSSVKPHGGNPRSTLDTMLQEMGLSGAMKIAATGRKFRNLIQLPSISEPEAVEHAFQHIKPEGTNCPAVISAGGETFMVYKLNRCGQITNVFTGNKCAAGTGEFFLQQLRRLDTSLMEAAQWSAEVAPYPVSGRCSVFCKSDCTHATNKGVPKAQVAAGLGRMMAKKILELLKSVGRNNVMLVGGTSQNQMMVRYLKESLPGLIIPPQAPYFEALGAALWALDRPAVTLPKRQDLFINRQARFETLPALAEHWDKVEFKHLERDVVRPGNVCVLGLDVGSTTTKAVLLRHQDDALLASVYLRTNGDPVGASKACYTAIESQIEKHVPPETISIVGLGVCGSGRHIAGLHAMTEGVINEITAHATAAVYFDHRVDTIFEIGGQDAKYTHITNGVPSDYAMNEACSAGTGSFLEESAWETMGIPMEEIAAVALKGNSPPNFSDQCAAFIASDIKNAIQEGMGRENIVAGLVYSICMNYSNRVKGHRPVGGKVFMQGGVCYNRAVPLAMAALCDKDIVVPPEPGLMGAFGVALEVKKRLANGLMPPGEFSLRTLAHRLVQHEKPFVCKGGKDKCDRRCKIARIRIDEQTYPFGGACNRYENLRKGSHVATAHLNLVRTRQQLIFEKYAPPQASRRKQGIRGRVGINRSFLVNTFYPLYANFFSALGFQPVLSKRVDPYGIDQRNAPFCFPAELAHGFFHSLLADPDPPDYLFLPHFESLPTINGERISQVCPLVQGEPFYLQATFHNKIQRLKANGLRILNPRLDLAKGLNQAKAPLVAMAVQMGVSQRAAKAAFGQAKARMEDCIKEMLAIGQSAMAELAADPEKMGVVLFSRPYNGYASEAHMGIPNKFASRGILVLPLDFLDLSSEPSIASMYWGMGQRIILAARKVQPHPQLFGTYITNFSCGPDSFIINFFRNAMGEKPSLTIELDSHSADAGIETRIDAFLDIVQAHRKVATLSSKPILKGGFKPASTIMDKGMVRIMTSSGQQLPLTDSRITLLFPSMGKLGTEALAASFRSAQVNAKALPPSDENILKIGRGHTSCKECLPLILTTGSLVHYIRNHRQPNEVVVYFMPNGTGPCRFGQYSVFMQDLIKKLAIDDVAIFSLSSEMGYDGLPADIHRRAWRAVVTSDVFEDIRAMLLANAAHVEEAISTFDVQFQKAVSALESGALSVLREALQEAAHQLGKIPLRRPINQVPTITLAGEIFVRRDGLSRQYLTEYLASKGFATVCTPVAEWILYADFLVNKGLADHKLDGVRKKLRAHLKMHVMRNDEKRIKKDLSRSGLVHPAPIEIESILDTAKPYISPHLRGEAILTIGSAIREVASETCGAIAIGPFGCMPNRLSEAILMEAMQRENKLASAANDHRLKATLSEVSDLPFLSIESDGSPLTQQVHAKLEAFCLRAARLHHRMMKASGR